MAITASSVAVSDTLEEFRQEFNKLVTDVTGLNAGSLLGVTGVVFEGATADEYETTLAVVDPTADRTITFPNETGTVHTTGGATTHTAITSSAGLTIADSGNIGSASDTDAIEITSGGVVSLTQDLYLAGNNKEMRFYEGDNYVGFEAPALSANQIWVLPTADGSSGQVLSTDGSGNLSWVTRSE